MKIIEYMVQYNDFRLPQCAKMVEVDTVCDERGQLCIAENAKLPFKVERVFWISGVPDGQTRGGHAHSICAELIFPLAGGFDIFVSDSDGERTYKMCQPDTGIYIGPNVWCELTNFKPGTVCMVLASHPYMAEGYINDYKDFLQK